MEILKLGLRFAAALLPRLVGTNPRSHHKGATGRVRTGDQLLPILCHCQLGKDIPKNIEKMDYFVFLLKHKGLQLGKPLCWTA